MHRRNEMSNPSRGKAIWGRALQLALAAIILAGVAPVHAQRGSDNRHEFKFDRHLSRRLAESGDGDSERVIVHVRPGARAGLIRRLQSAGQAVNGDLELVNSVALRASKRLLRQLAEDGDVLTLSADAPVQSTGLLSQPVGAPDNSTYSLRRTLGLGYRSPTGAGVTVAVIDSRPPAKGSRMG